MHDVNERAVASVGTASGYDGAPSESSRRHILAAAVTVTAGATVSSNAIAETNGGHADRRERGLSVLRQIGGQGFDGPITRLARVSEDMAHFTVEYPYGDVLSRPGLDLRLRQICTVSSLIAQGSVQPQLRFHMDGLLNVGGRPQDLVDLMYLGIAILGFPAAIDTIGIVRQIFSERPVSFAPATPAEGDGTDRYQRGVAAFNSLMHGDMESYLASFENVSPDLARWSVEFAFGEVLARDGLDAKTKHLAIISMLASLGNRPEMLRLHLESALEAGATRTEVIEALIQISVYAGFPAALNAFGVAAQVLVQQSGQPAGDVPVHLSVITSESSEVRRERGLAALAATSSGSGEAVVRSFDDIAPDIGRMIVEHAYGDVFCRPGIDPKTRELTACAALAALGTKATETPLRVHINAAISVGASRDEIVETILNLVPYCGYPAAQEAMGVAGEEFAKRGI